MPDALVVFVHGLWLNGSESIMLRRRVEAALGMESRSFHYASRSSTMVEVTAHLEHFIREHPARTLHFIGHSLGGLVLFRFLERYADIAPGRVVFLGTPSVASKAVAALGRFGWSAPLLGQCVTEELAHSRDRRWTLGRELGVIAGSRPVGLGQFFAHFDEPSDGTVAVSETRLPGAADHLVLPVSHMGMLLSTRVAQECATFLEHGRFRL